MSLGHSTSFRKGAFALTTIAALTSASYFPACAQQVAAAGQEAVPQITLNTDCSTYRPGVLMADTQCRIEKGKLIDAQLGKEKQGLASDLKALAKEREGLAKDQRDIACMRQLKVFLADGKVSRAKIIEYGKDRVCDLVKTLG